MADIAAQAGVSRALVSIVLRGVPGASPATRRRVLAVAAEIGYRPDSLAQGLRRSRSRNLGVLFSLRHPFEVELVEHLLPVAQARGYDLLLGPLTSGRRQAAVVDALLRYRCEGLVVVSSDLQPDHLDDLLKQAAVVEVGGGSSSDRIDVVRGNDITGTRLAIDHLVDLGHRSIAYLDGGPHPSAELRRTGYLRAMRAHGLDAQIRVITVRDTEEHGAGAAAQVLVEKSTTAILAANDLRAIDALDVLIRAGVNIPRQLSLVGYDDSRFGVLPGIDLTSVRQDAAKYAEQALSLLVERLARPTRRRQEVLLHPQLAVRGTTGSVAGRHVERPFC